MSELYIGTKIIRGEPMDAATFEAKIRPLPHQALYDVDAQGQAVGKPGYKVSYEDGYTSWSPKDVFERSYRRISDAERALMGTEL